MNRKFWQMPAHRITSVKKIGRRIGLGAGIVVLASQPVRAELVLEPTATSSAIVDSQGSPSTAGSQGVAQASAMRAEDRETVRQVMQSAERAASTLNQNPYAATSSAVQAQPGGSVMQNSQPILVAPVSISSAQQTAQVDVENLSKTEMMRRERVRAEIRNEDRLQERLEELRLRDERRREGELTSGGILTGASASASAGTVVGATLPVQTEAVGPSVAAVAVAGNGAGVTVSPSGTQIAALQPVPPSMTTDSVGTSLAAPVSASMSTDLTPASEKMVFVVSPRAGISNVISTVAYDVRPRFSIGGTLGVGLGEHFQLEAGYSYGEMGVAVNPSNPYIAQYSQWAMNNNGGVTPYGVSPYGYGVQPSPYGYYGAQPNPYGYGATVGTTPAFGNESVVLKQNVIDLGTKVHVLGTDYRLRPYATGGGSYARSFVNYDPRILALLTRSGLGAYGTDYDISQFLGYLGLGLDVKITKAISVSAGAKYYKVFSARETGTSPYWGFSDVDKQAVGGSLARADFYQVQGGLTFSF